MVGRSGVAWFLIGAVAGAIAVACPAAAARDSAQDPARVTPGLIDAARTSGAVRIIVQVVQDPQQSIGSAQEAVLTELAGTSFRVLHRYLNSPALALEAGEDALRVLDRSPHVRSVAPDFPVHPLGSRSRR